MLSRLARFYAEFEGIHPFIDGNGRTGRLLVNLELMKAGYPPIDIKFADRGAYHLRSSNTPYSYYGSADENCICTNPFFGGTRRHHAALQVSFLEEMEVLFR
mgnify:CR=1 FL=1